MEGYESFKYDFIFPSSTINNLVEIKLQTSAQLFEIKGLAQVKISRYGNDILNIIKEYVAKNSESKEEVSIGHALDKDDEVGNKLKQFRTETSKKDNVKPYIIFSNKEIEEIIKAKPKTKTKEQLLGIRGFGETKVEKYAEGIVDIFK